MAKFTCLATPLGRHHSPDGEIHVTRDRVKRWCKQFEEMQRAGVILPLLWGHQSSDNGGVPYQSEDEYQHWTARSTAGRITRMFPDPKTGGLMIEAEAAGAELDEGGNLNYWTKLPNGTLVKGSIREVSAAIHRWRDGTGRMWEDIPIHVALTPLPVCAGQKGFRQLSTSRGQTRGERPIFLSTVTLNSRRTTMTTGEPCTLFEPSDGPGDDLVESDLAVRMNTLDATGRMSHPLAVATRNRIWRREVKARLLTLCRKGLDPNAATGLWSSVNGEQGVRRLNTSGSSIRSGIEAQLREWESEFATRRPETPLPLSKEEREIVDLLTTRR